MRVILRRHFMKRIKSFEIDHTKLLEGLYVSRSDKFGNETITTFDIRFVRPNSESILSTDCIHAIEHLGATYFRNHEILSEKTVYFGPMGCRTGFYLLLHGSYSSYDILKYITDMLEFVINFKDEIPGASEIECGNYKDMSLEKAKKACMEYLSKLRQDNISRFNYQ